MDRRRFLRRLTAAGAVGAAVGVELGCGTGTPPSGSAATPGSTTRVTYQVKGFTCITCAVGLEAMLRGVRGVTEASASYGEHKVTIAFDEQVTSDVALKQFVTDCGFSVAARPPERI